MAHPEKMSSTIKEELKQIGLWDFHPRNLFRISWKNEPILNGGGFGKVNYLEIPSQISGVKARIILLIGKYFPTGSHKVGATFGPLVEKLIRGEFDPTTQKALWPSTGNYCRGGAYDSLLLACSSIAVLPEGMSQERFLWLKKTGTEIVPTPGSESNVKEVFDKCYDLKRSDPERIVVLNQFDEFGNAVWHYACTGPAIEEVYQEIRSGDQNLSALFLTQGSAGTLACGDYLKEKFPRIRICAGEALQCPTLLYNGYGEHRIEGIGDKHVPWIFNIKSLDMAAGIDDRDCLRIMRLFNETQGKKFLKKIPIQDEIVNKLDLLGISAIANVIGCIKTAKYYEMNEKDIIFSIATDSMELYDSRVSELRKQWGNYSQSQAAMDYSACLHNQKIDHMQELSYWAKKRLHNLKYFTWVEQRGKDINELNQQWSDEEYWKIKYRSYLEWDTLIRTFNKKTGLLK